MWTGVTPRFTQFLDNIALTEDQVNDGITKYRGITSCLNRAYWDANSEDNHRLLVGSWGKFTWVRPPRDIDILFTLPAAVYYRFLQRTGNIQSQLLQEVKWHLEATYAQTRMRGDGQVVVVPFNTYAVEVVPAFEMDNGQFLICDTNDGGRFKTIDPRAEIVAIQDQNYATNGNLRRLVRMAKVWQRECNVPLKSFQIELIAAEYMKTCRWAGNSLFWFDWIVRDFFAYVASKANGWVVVPGNWETVFLGDGWLSRAETAFGWAQWACHYEYLDMVAEAGDEWQKIFGTYVPKWV